MFFRPLKLHISKTELIIFPSQAYFSLWLMISFLVDGLIIYLVS